MLLSDTSTPLKLKIKQCKKEEPVKRVSLNHAEPSEVKSLAFPVSLC